MSTLNKVMRVMTGFLLGLGNSKLGRRIFTFSLPAVYTCPGRTTLCEQACYADRGRMAMPRQRRSYIRSWRASQKDNFVDRVVCEIHARQARVVRVHVSGDFYDANYARKWLQIMRACPQTRFFLYTRSWRIVEIRPELIRMARLRNVRVWWSMDRETGLPASVPNRIRVAYMAMNDTDIPDRNPDLVFRVFHRDVAKRVGPTLVCPSENGVTNTTCQKCKLCWASLEEGHDPRRLALPVV